MPEDNKSPFLNWNSNNLNTRILFLGMDIHHAKEMADKFHVSITAKRGVLRDLLADNEKENVEYWTSEMGFVFSSINHAFDEFKAYQEKHHPTNKVAVYTVKDFHIFFQINRVMLDNLMVLEEIEHDLRRAVRHIALDEADKDENAFGVMHSPFARRGYAVPQQPEVS